MKDIILIALTSEGCGHCHNLRGNGELGNGKQFGNFEFIKSHVNPIPDEKNVKLLNLHFRTMGGVHKEIIDISKIYLKNNIVYQEKYFPEGNSVMVKVLSSNSSNNITKIKEGKSNYEGDWFSFLDSKIPKQIENYTYFFPCFVVFELSDWKNGKNILGLTNAGFTMRREDGTYGIEKLGTTLSERNVIPQKLVTEAMTGIQEFKPHKDLRKEAEPAQKKEAKPAQKKEAKPAQKKEAKPAQKKEAKPAQKKEAKCKFIIKNYEDEE
jgi:hypothetical protein